MAVIVGSFTYFGCVWWMRIDEFALLVDLVRRKIGR
jgi:hypothetical protein